MSTRIVIVGGVAGGMSAATRARRLNEAASITVLEKGGYISFANCGLPYYIAGRIDSEDKLLISTPDKVRERFNIDARVGHEVIRIDRANKYVEAKVLASGETILLPYDKLILAVGASPIIPPIENVRAPNVFLMRSMEDVQAVQEFIQTKNPHSAAIVGAGFIGVEMAEALVDRGLAVTLIEKVSHALPPLDDEMARDVDAEIRRHGVNLIAGTGLKSLRATGNLVDAVELEDGRLVAADMVILSIGVRPNVKLASDAGLVIGPTGAIAVDEHQRTSDPEIYAVGDASEVRHGASGQPARVPLAGPANRQGRLAGEHAATGKAHPAPPVQGTAIVQVFDLAVGVTGLSESTARKAGLDIETAYVNAAHHAGYYPGAQAMRIKLVYERASGRIAGAQIVGREGVDKRLDVIVTLMHFGGTIDDLANLDLAYAPQFGSAKDPIHQAAMVARNQREGIMAAIGHRDLNGQQIVDVRTSEEFQRGALPRARNIPLDELRQRIGELDPAQATVVYCQHGQRGYVAQRILAQRGFANVKNLKGGYALVKTG
jgi:NADPH-dependent 2,4-dienoyl-CoA reductase/sulfur reductase-like enzyme/rhodanese-related sulfurtransferase